MKRIVHLLLCMMAVIILFTACGFNNTYSNKTEEKVELTAEEKAKARKMRIQAELDTTDATLLIGDIRLKMSKSEYSKAFQKLESETSKIRIGNAVIYTYDMRTVFDKAGSLVGLCLVDYGKYQTIGIIHEVDDDLCSIKNHLIDKYGEPDSTYTIYQKNSIPYEIKKEWIFNQRAILYKEKYAAGKYKGKHEFGNIYEGAATIELWYYDPEYYLEKKAENIRKKQAEANAKKEQERKEKEYSSNL